MGRGANWTSVDDIQLCKSWLHASSDPIVRTNQKSSSFWEKIVNHIQENNLQEMENNPGLVKEVRTQRSIQSRFAFINGVVAKFAGVYSQQQRNAASGTNTIDLERAALEVFHNQVPGGKSFDHRECWLVLKQHEKWASTGGEPLFEPSLQAQFESSRDPGTPTEPGTPTYRGFTEPERPRPIGVKKAKADLLQSKVTQRQLKLVEKANIMASKRQRIMQQQVALSYLKLDVSLVPVDMREIFISTRNGLLNEIRIPEEDIPPMADSANEDVDEDSPLEADLAADANPGRQDHEDFAGYSSDQYVHEQHQHGNIHIFDHPGPSSSNIQSAFVDLDEIDLRIGM